MIIGIGTVILHSEDEQTVPIADSEDLVRNTELPESALIQVGTEHRLADDESLAAMLGVVQEVAQRHTKTRSRGWKNR